MISLFVILNYSQRMSSYGASGFPTCPGGTFGHLLGNRQIGAVPRSGMAAYRSRPKEVRSISTMSFAFGLLLAGVVDSIWPPPDLSKSL